MFGGINGLIAVQLWKVLYKGLSRGFQENPHVEGSNNGQTHAVRLHPKERGSNNGGIAQVEDPRGTRRSVLMVK